MLEVQKTKCSNHILILTRRIDELQSSLPQKRGEMTYMNLESGRYDNTGNFYPTYPEPYTSSYSVQLFYSDY
jgi:hypothetical protein